MIDELDDLLQPWLTHSPSAECTTWTATEWLTRRRWPRLFRSKPTPRNIAVCLENTADWDSNFLKLKTPINLYRPILQTIFWIKSENGGKMKCLQRRRSTTCWVRELWSQRTRQRSEPRISSTGETSTAESSIMLKFNNILFGNNIACLTLTLPSWKWLLQPMQPMHLIGNFFGNPLQSMWCAGTGEGNY